MSTFDDEISLSSLDGTNGFRLLGQYESSATGYSVARAGDVNGDGIDDIIVGAPNATIADELAGAAYVIFGTEDGFPAEIELLKLDGTDGFKIVGHNIEDFAGNSVSSAGDINGDGFDDILIGAPRTDELNGVNSGSAYVIFGTDKYSDLSEPFPPLVFLMTLNGDQGFQIVGQAAGDVTGESVSAAGDVNGDGFDDIIIGAYGMDANGNISGGAFVIFGSDTEFPADLNLAIPFDETVGFRIVGAAAGDFSGYSVAAAGDVNGDGIDDLIISAPLADPNGNSSAGAAYVLFGTTEGFGSQVDLSTLTGTTGFKLIGEESGNKTGWSVASAGDFNGDGIADMIVGAPDAKASDGTITGAAYVIFGTDEGFPSEVDLGALDGTTGFRIGGEAEFDFTGWCVSSAGDVNSDGFDDILVGAYQADSPDVGGGAGAVYLIFGTDAAMAAEYDLSSLDGTTGFKITGAAAFDDAGYSVSAAGDINNDGFDDIVVGATSTDTFGIETGGAYVIFGKATGGTIFDDVLKGSSGINSISGLAGNDYILGAGGNDILYGGEGNDTLEGGTGSDNLYGEEGNDTLEGGIGSDDLFGGAGDDLYIIDGSDTLTELAGGGTDTVRSSATFTLAVEFEHLLLTGSADTVATGNAGANSLTGNSGSNTLDGGGGSDVMAGGAGNDTYITDGGDTITETADQGTDTVRSSVSYTLGVNVENLVLTGSAKINGTGNQAANSLTGNTADNTLDGAGGADTMAGGTGNDTYTTDGGDTITEASGQGTDTVRSSVSFTLGSNLETLVLTGSAAINGTGNSAANTITGNNGNNSLNGGAGRDTLTGGSGSDSFIFATTPGSANVDKVTDFNVPADTFRLENAVFTGLPTGTLKADAFVKNTSGNAADGSDRIIYESDTGKLFFDRDGTGAAAKVHFATIGTNLSLTNADFIVF